MTQWLPKDLIDSLPPKYGERLDLLGNLIVDFGDVISTIAIATDKVEEKQIEEAETSNYTGEEKPNLGFILEFFGAAIVTIGDVLSTAGQAIDIEQGIILDKQAEQEKMEQDSKIKEMQYQINILQKEMNSLLRITDSLRKEVLFLQRATHSRYL
ncbi:hypothetical protein [Peribacillus simplex]|uniref:hypothetical protein n=1 Tax=Peribacillus simplex TaxID=1478 RepID=UPI003D2B748A